MLSRVDAPQEAHVAVQHRILVIDDDETILELLQDALSPEYQVVTAHDALEGVELMMDGRFELMIIDLGMPVLNGVDLIQKIRAHSPFARVPILVLSAYPELRDRLGGSDVQAVMAKPFSIDQLNRTVSKIIRGTSEPEASPSSAPPPGGD
jgi:two-component system, OmpR family, KDP operon response regulator KdpE